MSAAARGSPALGRVALAALAAGPVFVASLAVLAPVMTPAPIAPDEAILVGVALLAPVILVGFVLAIVPTMIGMAALLWAGGQNDGLRVPALWAMVGAGAAGSVGAYAWSAPDQHVTTALAMTGAVSALICRAGARWSDR